MIALKTVCEASMELRVKVRNLRVAKGWSQRELAARAGVKFGTYVAFEQGANITLDKFLRIADAIGRLSAVEQAFAPEQKIPTIAELTAQTVRKRGRTISKE